ncbi:MAG: hypothetical protein LBB62_02835 [Proteiniphilum sp.]|jgi:hypothetical protein|nr:hypothetical protein [Proteiniphilum sp.]
MQTKSAILNDRDNILFNCESDSIYLINNIFTDERFYIIEATHDNRTYKILSAKPLIESSNKNVREIKVGNCYPLKLNRIFPPKNIPFTEAINIKAPIKREKEVYEAINLHGLFIVLP